VSAAIPQSRRVFVFERHLLLVVTALVSIYTLAPFEFSFSKVAIIDRMMDACRISPADVGLKLAGHWLAFAVLGFVAAVVYEPAIQRAGFLRFALFVSLFCLLLEGGQIVQEARHARVTDLASNIIAALFGGMLWMRGKARTGQGWRMGFRKWETRMEGALLVIALTCWVLASAYPLGRLSKMNWNRDFKLVIGNEVDQSEPWLGEIRQIGIHARPFTAAQVQDLFEHGGDSSRHESLLVQYDFTKSAPQRVEPTGALRSAELSLVLPAQATFAPDEGGILLHQATTLLSHGTDPGIASAVMATGSFSIEAWLRALPPNQQGPARIVSLSDGIWTRNFMLGQENADLVFRVRNGVNGDNGMEHALRIKGAIDDSLHHVVATYDHGVSTIFRDGRPLAPIVDLREPFVYLGLGPSQTGRAAGILLLFLLAAIPITRFGNAWSPRNRFLATAAGMFCAGAIPYLATAWIGGPWRLALLVTIGVVLLIAFPCTVSYVFRPEISPLSPTS
jgi:hypothetical protein